MQKYPKSSTGLHIRHPAEQSAGCLMCLEMCNPACYWTGGNHMVQSGRQAWNPCLTDKCIRMKQKEKKMIYYTADLHLGHANIIRFCSRPFTDPEEMDRVIMENWNRKVHRDDTVYIVGDFMFRADKAPASYLSGLKGRKILIRGNHDAKWMRQTDLSAWFEDVQDLMTIRDRNREVILCHYPLLSWEHASKGSYMVYGHIHNNTNEDFFPLILARPRMLNAGVDVNGFEPVTLEEMEERNRRFQAALAGKSDQET